MTWRSNVLPFSLKKPTASSRKEGDSSIRRLSGFTLLELMVVLVILGLLAGIAAPQVIKQLGKAKRQTAKVQVDALSASLDLFFVDVGRYPTQDEGLQALMASTGGTWDGPYLKKRESLVDPWGRPYRYKFPGIHGKHDVYTLGADEKEGGEGDDADIGSW